MKTKVALNCRISPLFGIVGLALIQAGFAGGSCGGASEDERQHLVVPDRPECGELDEVECLARPDCLPSYDQTPCACPECFAAPCDACECPPPAFAGCELRVEPPVCEAISDESACLARPECEAIYSDCASGGAAAPIGDEDRIAPPPCEGGFAACQTRHVPTRCEGLDEASCLADPSCEPEYSANRCAAMPCLEGEECGRCGGISYTGCHDRGGCECEPVLCDLYCEFGFARDDRGCEVCACNPPPVGECRALTEEQCVVTPGCQPVYDGGGACACPGCVEGETCPPCECDPIPSRFAYCTEVLEDKCAWLDEQSCNAEPSCVAEYLETPCACDATSSDCLVDCHPVFVGCHSGNSTCGDVLCDMYCEFGFQTDRNGCEICACNPPPSGCAAKDETSCLSDPSCQPIYGETGCACPACDPASGVACGPCDCPPPTRFFAGCTDVDRCANLDEASCNATPECQAEYGSICARMPCRPGPDGTCAEVPPCDAEASFLGCHQRFECPPIPAIWCEYGNVIDPMTGCATGQCNPNPECAGLSEADCVSRSECSAVYAQLDCLMYCEEGDPNCGCSVTFVECR